MTGAARAAAVADASRCRKFEYFPIFLEERPRRPKSSYLLRSNSSVHTDPKNGNNDVTEYVVVSQLINYDALAFSSLEDAATVTSRALKSYWENLAKQSTGTRHSPSDGDPFLDVAPEPPASSPSTEREKPVVSLEAVEMLECRLWRNLDEMVRLLSMAGTAPVPLPSQLLGLLPKRGDWPKEFVLEEYAQSLSAAGSGSSGTTIGVFAKSPFVRVDRVAEKRNATPIAPSSNTNAPSYSPLRRAQRLSYAVWLLLDGLAMDGAKPPSRDVILGMNSIGERLDAAKKTLEGINGILRRLIPENRKD